MNSIVDDEWGEVTRELAAASAAPLETVIEDETTRPVDVEWSVDEDGTVIVTCTTKHASTR